MPESVEIPAPVSTTTRRACSTSDRARPMMSSSSLIVPTQGQWYGGPGVSCVRARGCPHCRAAARRRRRGPPAPHGRRPAGPGLHTGRPGRLRPRLVGRPHMCGARRRPRGAHPGHAQCHPHAHRARPTGRRRPPDRQRLHRFRPGRARRAWNAAGRARRTSAHPPDALHVGHHRAAQGRHHGPVGRGDGPGRLRGRGRGLALRPHDLHMVCSPMYHTVSIRFASCTLLAGGSLAILGRFDAATALDVLRRHRPTTTFLVPIHLQRILQCPDLGPDERFDSLRLLAHAGAPCPESVKRATMARARTGAVWEFYGSTEAQFTVCPPEDWLEHPGTVGRARPGRRLDVVPVGDEPDAKSPSPWTPSPAPSGATCPPSPASAIGMTPPPRPPPGEGPPVPSATWATSIPPASST